MLNKVRRSRGKITTAARIDYSDTCCFLQCKNEKQVHTLFPVLFSDCMFLRANSTKCIVAFIGSGSADSTRVRFIAVFALTPVMVRSCRYFLQYLL